MAPVKGGVVDVEGCGIGDVSVHGAHREEEGVSGETWRRRFPDVPPGGGVDLSSTH